MLILFKSVHLLTYLSYYLALSTCIKCSYCKLKIDKKVLAKKLSSLFKWFYNHTTANIN